MRKIHKNNRLKREYWQLASSMHACAWFLLYYHALHQYLHIYYVQGSKMNKIYHSTYTVYINITWMGLNVDFKILIDVFFSQNTFYFLALWLNYWFYKSCLKPWNSFGLRRINVEKFWRCSLLILLLLLITSSRGVFWY